MRIEEIVSFISEIVPSTYFANTFPSKVDDCIFVRIEGGGSPNDYVTEIRSPSVQFGIRHSDGREAERIAHDIWNVFHGREHFEIGTTRIKFARCDQSEPIYLDVDKNGRTMYSVNVSFVSIE